MQFLQGKKIQSEFCHLINTLLDSARQVVVAADRPPHELESLDPRVRSRLQGGVALEIGAPDYDMRLAMLQQRLENAKKDDLTLDISDRSHRACREERHIELPRTGRRVQPAGVPPLLRAGSVDRPCR
jgi:chromosomal replication initiation ATPase DnaA